GLHPSPAQATLRPRRQGANPHHSRRRIPHFRGKGGVKRADMHPGSQLRRLGKARQGGVHCPWRCLRISALAAIAPGQHCRTEGTVMISFKSIFSRIIFLHVIALVITAIVMPVVLYWFFKWAANDLHDQAMREQAQLVAHYLGLRADGSWTLDLPPALEDIYSQAVGRSASAWVDEDARFLFSSPKDRSPIFTADPRSSNIAYLETRRGKAAISGVSLLKEVDGRKVWVQVGEDLAHRDVIVDDIVA